MKKYFITNGFKENLKPIGPFNTIKRAQAFKKKHHYFGNIIEKEIENKQLTRKK